MSGLLPLIQRELRVAARHRPSLRAHWKTFGGAVAVAGVLLLFFSSASPRGMFQLVFCLEAYCLARAPLLFAGDPEAGSQSLLRLAGLGAVQVFWGSLLGALLLVLEGALLMTPVLMTGLWWSGARPSGVLMLTLLPSMMLVFGTILRAFGRVCSRSATGAASIALGVAIFVGILPLGLDLLMSTELGPTGRRLLYVWGGWRDWTSLRHTCAGHDNGTGAGRLLLRLLVWSVVFVSLATWLFHRQWRQADAPGDIFRRGRELWNGSAAWRRARLPLPSGEAYPWRLRRNRSWEHGFILLAPVFGLVGLVVAVLLPWPALVMVAMVYVAAVDVLLHIAVSRPVAEDRLEGGFELLLTAGVEPAALFAGLNAEAQRLRRVADRGGAILLLGFLLMSVVKLRLAGTPSPGDWLALAAIWCWPLVYALSLHWLSLDRPIAMAINAAAVLHQGNPPGTPLGLILVTGLGLWFALHTAAISLLVAGVLGLLVVFGWVAIRESTANDRTFAYEELRSVAAEPVSATAVNPSAKASPVR
jgi:hypothetical protein